MPELNFASDFAAIVFDCDGTLMDTEECWKSAREIVLDGYGVRPDDGFAARTTGMHYSECGRLMATIAGRPEQSELITRQLLDAFRALAAENPTTMPGAAEFVAQVSEFAPLAVASNCPGDVVETCLDAAGLLPYFRYIAVPGEHDRPKPHPDVYVTASRRCGAEPEHCLAFEDTRCGIDSAVSAGLRVIGIGHHPKEADVAVTDHWVSSLADADLLAWAKSEQAKGPWGRDRSAATVPGEANGLFGPADGPPRPREAERSATPRQR